MIWNTVSGASCEGSVGIQNRDVGRRMHRRPPRVLDQIVSSNFYGAELRLGTANTSKSPFSTRGCKEQSAQIDDAVMYPPTAIITAEKPRSSNPLRVPSTPPSAIPATEPPSPPTIRSVVTPQSTSPDMA